MTSNLGFINLSRYNFYDNRPILQVEQTVAQSIPNTTTTNVTLTTVIVDNYAGYATGTSLYTVKVAGWYRVAGCTQYVSNATGSRYSRAIINSISSPFVICNTDPPTGVCSCPMGGILLLQVGDVINMATQQISGAALSTQVGSGFNSFFALEWLRCP